jgi:hypothetical protein
VLISATSETLRIVRQRVAIRDGITPWRGKPTVAAAGSAPRARGGAVSRLATPGPAITAIAVVVSCLAAGALVIGFVWVAATSAPKPPTGTPVGTLPYAIAWSAASLASLAGSLGSLFVAGGRRLALVILSTTLAAALLAVAVASNALLA